MKNSRKQRRTRRRSNGVTRLVKWAAAVAVLALVLYGLSRTAGVPYDENDIGVVNFSDLSAGERRSALQTANRARCSCGCGMTLAQCVATDMTCPLRDQNIQAIRTMVRDASES